MYIILYTNSITNRTGHITSQPVSYSEATIMMAKLSGSRVNSYTIEPCK